MIENLIQENKNETIISLEKAKSLMDLEDVGKILFTQAIRVGRLHVDICEESLGMGIVGSETRTIFNHTAEPKKTKIQILKKRICAFRHKLNFSSLN